MFKLISKTSSQKEGWFKSIKAMECGSSVVIQVSTQQRNTDGSYSVAEALTTVPQTKIKTYYDENKKVKSREIIKYYLCCDNY